MELLHQPPFHLIIRFLSKFNTSEIFLRIPSVVFGVVSIYLIYIISRKIFDTKIALTSGFLLSISPFHIWISRDSTPYSLFCFISLATFYLTYIIICESKRENLKVSMAQDADDRLDRATHSIDHMSCPTFDYKAWQEVGLFRQMSFQKSILGCPKRYGIRWLQGY